MSTSQRLCRFGSLLLLPCGLMIASLALPGQAAQRPTKSAAAKKEADDTATKKAEAAKRDSKPAGPKSDQDEKSKPQAHDFDTADGVLIAATYFPPLRPGKDVPVVMLLHGYGEKQSVFWPTGSDRDLAFALQDKGYAVLTFDFRGHGHSTSRVGAALRPPDAKGGPAGGKLDFRDLGTRISFATLLDDIEAAKRFLVQRNDAGELNLAKLGLVGCELGASMAVLWSFQDWQFVPQVGFTGKQGQDVQSLVLVSPQYNFKGIAITNQLTFMQKAVPMQVVVGKKDSKAFGEADKMYQATRKARPSSGESDSKLVDLNTKLQGGKLLNPDPELDLNVDKELIAFFDQTLKRKAAKWEKRKTEGDTGN